MLYFVLDYADLACVKISGWVSVGDEHDYDKSWSVTLLSGTSYGHYTSFQHSSSNKELETYLLSAAHHGTGDT